MTVNMGITLTATKYQAYSVHGVTSGYVLTYCNLFTNLKLKKMDLFQVNVQVMNKSALHCAVTKNHLSVLKVILEYKPNLEIKVSVPICVSLQ